MSSLGWIGVDLDGTLAHYDGWQGELHVGRPIPLMVERVQAWLAQGYEVRIMTARASGIPNPDAIKAIEEWTERHIGKRLRVTAEKDYQMIQLWDDRAVGVQPNTGLVNTGEGA